MASNDQILERFRAAGIQGCARTLSVFLYSPNVKPVWKPEETTAGGDDAPGRGDAPGWLEETKTPDQPTKGIIIAGKFDKRLYCALKMLKGAEVYLYQVDFKLSEFREG